MKTVRALLLIAAVGLLPCTSPAPVPTTEPPTTTTTSTTSTTTTTTTTTSTTTLPWAYIGDVGEWEPIAQGDGTVMLRFTSTTSTSTSTTTSSTTTTSTTTSSTTTIPTCAKYAYWTSYSVPGIYPTGTYEEDGTYNGETKYKSYGFPVETWYLFKSTYSGCWTIATAVSEPPPTPRWECAMLNGTYICGEHWSETIEVMDCP